MGLYRNTQTGDVHAAFGATGDWLMNQGGLYEEIEVNDPDELKGKALDAALKDAGLPKTGDVDAKRARLTEWQEAQFAGQTAPPEQPVEQPPTDPSQGQ